MSAWHRVAASLLVVMALCASPLTHAVEPELLPVEQAFVPSARASADGIELHWDIAPGYYLYRHRISVSDPAAARAGVLHLPAGEAKQDEFFGAVETYHNRLDARWVPASASAPLPGTLSISYQGCADAGICYPPQRRQIQVTGTAHLGQQAEAVSGTIALAENAQSSATHWPQFAFALGLAVLGGLVLNLMPCVLPILSLKVMGLVESGTTGQRARQHALWYTVGVLGAFGTVGTLVVALRAAGRATGWGFQLQQPLVVAILAYIMVAVGLSMSGVYTISGRFTGVGQSLASRSGRLGDFFTGVLACVVASPCVAPFMGTALAYAFAAPVWQSLLVFLALGLGLALPLVVIGCVPSLARRLPQPGPWMETLKQVLAYPMYLAAAWLLWVLGKQRGVDALAWVLAGAILLSLGLWWYERHRWTGHLKLAVMGLALALVALYPLHVVHQISAPAAQATAGHAAGGTPYSARTLDELRRKQRTVFVNMTADWCVTCKANERTVLSTAGFQEALRASNAVYMEGDWTNGDPAISRFITDHRAVGVPLYVVYRPGREPTVLPGILDAETVRRALSAGR